DAQAAAAVLHTQMGLSHGKVASVFRTLFGITLTRGASAQIDLRAAARLEPDYQLILGDVRSSEQIAADETGWRIGGHPAWLHAWVGDRATAYGIDSQRSADVLERVIGRDWSGLLALVTRPRAVPEYATLAKHLRNHFEQWFAFVFDPRIEPTNWKAEQAIRPAVVNRKVWGGNRTAAGAGRADVRVRDVPPTGA